MSDNDKTPSVKLPSARDISRTDFTPHGINRGKGSLKRPANKAELRKKRLLQTGATVLALAVVGGVGYTAYALTRPEENFNVSGTFNKDATVKFPEVAPYTATKTKVVLQGSGEQLKKGDTAYLNFATYQWTGEKKFEAKSKYKEQGPTPYKVGEGTDFKALDSALGKAKVGSRILITIPVKDLGESGSQLGLKNTDNLVFLVDVATKQQEVTGASVKVGDAKLPEVTDPKKAGEAPGLSVPKSEDPPKELVVKTIVQGTGPVVAKGQTLATNYEGKIWRTDKQFDSSWTNGQPANFEIGNGKVIPGWDEALVGQKVGSRVLVVVPPDKGYKKEGNAQAGIKGTDTLVFVVDILAAI